MPSIISLTKFKEAFNKELIAKVGWSNSNRIIATSFMYQSDRRRTDDGTLPAHLGLAENSGATLRQLFKRTGIALTSERTMTVRQQLSRDDLRIKQYGDLTQTLRLRIDQVLSMHVLSLVKLAFNASEGRDLRLSRNSMVPQGTDSFKMLVSVNLSKELAASYEKLEGLPQIIPDDARDKMLKESNRIRDMVNVILVDVIKGRGL